MLPFIILTVFSFPLIANAIGGAGSTCHNFAIVANTADISAQCTGANGNDVSTQINLSGCLGNQNGQLGCEEG